MSEAVRYRVTYCERHVAMMPVGTTAVSPAVTLEQTGSEYVLASDYDKLAARCAKAERRVRELLLAVEEAHDGGEINCHCALCEEAFSIRYQPAADTESRS